MNELSYNEAVARQSMVRYILWPGRYNLVAEFVIGCLALVLFNVTSLSNQWLAKPAGVSDPFAGWSAILTHLLTKLQGYYFVQRGIVFILWAFIGALAYVLIFRVLQVSFATKQTVDAGMYALREGHGPGLMRWLASLHDFFLRSVIVVFGLFAIACGSLICFSLASQELRQVLHETFPSVLISGLFCLVLAFFTVRLVVIGLCLLSRHFRQWYVD